MVGFERLDHPAVELKPPLDGERHRFEVPRDTTLFFWGALAVGTRDRIPQFRSRRGKRLFDAGVESRQRMSWSVSIDGESVPLLTDSYYRADGYKGLAWWIAVEPPQLPVSVSVQFETSGQPPTDRADQIVLWTDRGEPISWGTTRESTIDLDPSDAPASEFQTAQEDLWGSHTVYRPQEPIKSP